MKYIAASAFLLLFFVSCKKYSEGPLLSLRSREARLINSWVCAKVMVNNQESTPFYSKYSYAINANNSYTENNGYTVVNGTWALTSNDDSLIVTFNNNQVLHRFKIMRLKNRSLWLVEDRNTSTYEWHLKSN
jgi:hypothetical protein